MKKRTIISTAAAVIVGVLILTPVGQNIMAASTMSVGAFYAAIFDSTNSAAQISIVSTSSTLDVEGDFTVDTDVLAVDTTNDVVSTSGWITQPYAATTAQSYSLASAGKAAYIVQTAGEAATFHLMTDLLTTPGAGGLITIKTGDASDIVIDTQGAETIDGAATYTIDATMEAVQILIDGTGYQVVGAYLE